LLSFVGIVVEEKVKGSASLVLSKPLSRRSFILSKFIASITITTFAFLLSIAGFMYYTYLLFPGFPMNNIVLGFFLLWIYFIFVISVSIFASTITKSYTVSAIIAFSVYIVMTLLANFSSANDFMPTTLANVFSSLLTGYKTFGDIAFTFVFTIFLIAALITGSMELFRRQEV
jgi:ABC-2 type transport system permease protein